MQSFQKASSFVFLCKLKASEVERSDSTLLFDVGY